MPFSFRRSGSFTGPGFDLEYRDNDDFSPQIADATFPNDVGFVLVNTLGSPDDYVYMHLAGTNTSNVTLERSSGPIATFNVDANSTIFSGNISAQRVTAAIEVTASGTTLTSRKPFDIPHPTKEGWRLRHVCLEGPESGVYYRGRLTGNNVIDLPDYWEGLIDPETITVNLTQIGSSQDLIIDKIEWGKRIIIKSGNASAVDCYYMINAERKDGEKLIVEYEGKTIDDYPGDNSIYSINK